MTSIILNSPNTSYYNPQYLESSSYVDTDTNNKPTYLLPVMLCCCLTLTSPLLLNGDMYIDNIYSKTITNIESVTTSQTTNNTFEPKTALGKKLLAIRNRAIANGMQLLSIEEINNEVAERRGVKDSL